MYQAIPKRPGQYGIRGFWYRCICLLTDASILSDYYGRRVLGLPQKEKRAYLPPDDRASRR